MQFQNWLTVFLFVLQQRYCKEISALKWEHGDEANYTDVNFTSHINVTEDEDPTPEINLVYFRDDLGLNALHLTWHIIYSMVPLPTSTRRGELFYYLHNQVLNHYNADRYAFGMKKVKPLPINLNNTENIFDQVIEEGYYPHFKSPHLKDLFRERHPNSHYTNIFKPNGPALNVTLKNLTNIYLHILNSIKNDKVLLNNGTWISINGTDEINVVGDFIESTSEYHNSYYESFHNMLHLVLAFLSDTDVQAPTMGGMFHLGMSMRDPIFYRFHQLLENIYREYKNQLSPYLDTDLNFETVQIIKAETHSFYEDIGYYNKLMTFIDQRNVTVFGGIAFLDDDYPVVPLSFLNHVPFEYSILVNNTQKSPVEGYMRIFLSPSHTDNGKEVDGDGLRLHAIEMDRFLIKLPPGISVVTQSSLNSACTLNSATEFERFNYNDKSGDVNNNLKNYCLCGYPHHLLLPRGREIGMGFSMFVMISNGSMEKVESSRPLEQCDDGWTLCGWKDALYPDKRMMGYPFDRRLSSNHSKWFDRSNMLVFNITIVHLNTTDDQSKSKFIFSNIIIDSTLHHYSIYIILGITLYVIFVVIISVILKCSISSKSSSKEYPEISYKVIEEDI